MTKKVIEAGMVKETSSELKNKERSEEPRRKEKERWWIGKPSSEKTTDRIVKTGKVV